MNRTTAEEQVRSLLREKSYKKFLLIGVVCLVVVALLNSFLFALVLEVLKLALLLAGIAALCYAAFIAYPDLKKRYDDEINKKSQ